MEVGNETHNNLMKSILCFGDSNTWGYNPINSTRFDFTIRWTGGLQNLLGAQYRIIEEGMRGRTASIGDPTKRYMNSKDYLIPCLYSHTPMDLVIVCLGTNDLNFRFNLTLEDIIKSMKEIIKIIKSTDRASCNPPKILLMCPVELYGVKGSYNEMSVENSKQLSKLYKKLADETNCYFFDAGSVARASPLDCAHLDETGHKEIAKALHNIIVNEIKL
jgi:lysophospholipase L1-like esterase